MRSMTRTASVLSMAACSLAAFPALAGAPAALKMVPSDADVVIATPSIGALLNDVDAMNALMGDMGVMELTMGMAMVRGMPGLDLNGSAAVILDLDEEDLEREPEMLALIPVSDFSALTQGREVVDGVVALSMGADPVYFRDLGSGYCVMSNDSAMVSGFSAADNSVDEIVSMLGVAGSRVAAHNDIMVRVGIDALRSGAEEMYSELEAQGEMLELMVGPEAAQGFDMFMRAMKTTVADGDAFIGGINIDMETGLSMDIGVQFTEGSETGSYLMNDGDAGSYMSKLPMMDFFFAGAFDYSGEGIQRVMGAYGEMVSSMDTTGAMDGLDMNAVMTAFSGGSMMMGATDAMMMQGLFSNALFYGATDDTDACIENFRAMYGMAGAAQQPGMTMTGSVSEETVSVDGVEAYTHALKIEMDPSMMGGGGMGAPNPAMMMQMMYGPSKGPNGYIAPTDGGVVVTMSQNAELLSKAVGATRGRGSLSTNRGIAKAASMLPENRVMEMYVGVDHLLNTAGPMLMMFGILPEFEPVSALTPVAMGATADGGAVMMRTVVPVSTLKTALEMVPEGAMGGGGSGGWDDGSGDSDDDGMAF